MLSQGIRESGPDEFSSHELGINNTEQNNTRKAGLCIQLLSSKYSHSDCLPNINDRAGQFHSSIGYEIARLISQSEPVTGPYSLNVIVVEQLES